MLKGPTFSSSCGPSRPACPVSPASLCLRCPSRNLKDSRQRRRESPLPLCVSGFPSRSKTCQGRQSLTVSADHRLQATSSLLLLPEEAADGRLDALLRLAVSGWSRGGSCWQNHNRVKTTYVQKDMFRKFYGT